MVVPKKLSTMTGGQTNSLQHRSTKDSYLITTQPGWAFTTLRELRDLGIDDHISFHHRDSSMLCHDRAELKNNRLVTPATVFGILAQSGPFRKTDPTENLINRLKLTDLKTGILNWISMADGSTHRRFSITTELYGKSSVRRDSLQQHLESIITSAFPRWHQRSDGVRIICKSDTDMAVLGIQLYTNLTGNQDGLPGSIRQHIANGLLTIAGVTKGDTVVDPFMGSGTILKAARNNFYIDMGIGLEIDLDAFTVATGNIAGKGFELYNISFEDIPYSSLPEGYKLVSNVPFGVRFQQIQTPALLKFLKLVKPRVGSIALLISRDQAREIKAKTRLKLKNVLVLGQPASILHGNV